MGDSRYRTQSLRLRRLRFTARTKTIELTLTIILRACLHGGGGPHTGEVTCGRSPHLSCKRDQIKMRDYMDRRVTPPKRERAPSPAWGPPLPFKQALRPMPIKFSGYKPVNSKTWWTWRVISIIVENKPHAHHETHLRTMKLVTILIPSFHGLR